MTRADTFALIADHFGVHELNPSDTLADLGADALDCIEMLIEIDERLGVDLPDDAIGLETAVSEIVEMVGAARREAA